MPDQDPRDPWFVSPVTLSRRTAVGVGAGVGLVGIVAIVLLVVLAGDRDAARLHIEGVGEVEGPLLVYMERGRDRESNDHQWHIAVHDLGTGKEWVAMELESGEDISWRATNQVVIGPYWVVVAGKSLLRITATEMTRVSLDGGTEHVVAGLSKWPYSHPRASPDGTMVYFLDHTYAIVVLDLQSGDDVLRVEPGDPRIEALGRQWPLAGVFPLWGPDGAGILLWSLWTGDRPLVPWVVLTLDGDLRGLPEGATVSEDLHYAIRGQPLAADEPRNPAPHPWYLSPWGNSRMMGFSDSFEVVELRSGRVLRTVSAEEGHSLWYVWSSPGRIYYVVSPQGSDEISPDIRALDIATGETLLVSGEQMFEESDSAFSAELRLAVWDAWHVECLEVTASARAICEPLREAVVEVLSPPTRRTGTTASCGESSWT